MTITDTRLVHDTLTVGELRRLLDGLDDQLPVAALHLTAHPDANIGRVSTSTAHQAHLAHDNGHPAAIWILTHDAGDGSPLGRVAPAEIATARACGCVYPVPVEHGIVHFAADSCPHHQPHTSQRLYRELVAHAAASVAHT